VELDKIVQATGRVAKGGEYRIFEVFRQFFGRFCQNVEITQLFQHIIGGFHQFRTLLDQLVATTRDR
jgi:phage-related protein